MTPHIDRAYKCIRGFSIQRALSEWH